MLLLFQLQAHFSIIARQQAWKDYNKARLESVNEKGASIYTPRTSVMQKHAHNHLSLFLSRRNGRREKWFLESITFIPLKRHLFNCAFHCIEFEPIILGVHQDIFLKHRVRIGAPIRSTLSSLRLCFSPFLHCVVRRFANLFIFEALSAHSKNCTVNRISLLSLYTYICAVPPRPHAHIHAVQMWREHRLSLDRIGKESGACSSWETDSCLGISQTQNENKCDIKSAPAPRAEDDVQEHI